MSESLEDRVRRLEDRAAIQELGVLYGFIMDERDEKGIREIFCEEQHVFQSDDRDPIDESAMPIVCKSLVAGMEDVVVGVVRIDERSPGLWYGSRLGVASGFRRLRGCADRLHDRLVPRAAAEVAAERAADRLLVRVRVALEQVDGGHDDPGRAEAALEPVVLHERVLQRVPHAAPRQPLDGRDLRSFGLQGEHGAALHRPAVEEDGAGAALARVAPDVRSGEPEPVAQRMDEERASFHLERVPLAVDDELDGVRHSRAAPRPSRAGTRGRAPGRSWASP